MDTGEDEGNPNCIKVKVIDTSMSLYKCQAHVYRLWLMRSPTGSQWMWVLFQHRSDMITFLGLLNDPSSDVLNRL